MKIEILNEIDRLITSARRVLVTSHIRPDGDAVGSVLGFGLALEEAGKEVQMVLADGVPKNYRHLPGSDRVIKRPEGDFDLLCVVDSSDLVRIGGVLDGYGKPQLNIDHHITNINFAQVNLVNPQAVSTTEILADIILMFANLISQPVATALLNGLISDTLGFRTTNMTSGALRLAADLMDAGADLPHLYNNALINRSFAATKFWGKGLAQLQRNDSVVWTTLTMEDRKQAGYHGRDDADLITVLSAIVETDIAIIFVEQPGGRVKVSWRSKPGIDVSQIALKYGGGGHPAAAGAEFKGAVDDIRQKVLKTTTDYINQL